MTNRKPDIAPTLAEIGINPGGATIRIGYPYLPAAVPVFAIWATYEGIHERAIGRLQPQLQAVDARTERFRHLWDR
jgi:hypothetical protein